MNIDIFSCVSESMERYLAYRISRRNSRWK